MTRTARITAALIVPALLLMATPSSAQTVRYVDVDATGSADGTSWTHAFTDLQDALDVALAGDQVWIAEGTYKPSVPTQVGVPRSASFVLADGVGLYGGFAGTEASQSQAAPLLRPTILSGDIGVADLAGDNAWHVVTVAVGAGPGTRLEGLTIRDGQANGDDLDDYGGGIYMTDASLTMHRCTLRNNTARGSGAGLYANHAVELTITRCDVHDNVATLSGAGMGVRGDTISGVYFGSLVLTDTVFHDNTATNGAALVVGTFADVLIADSSFEDNHVTGAAGGLYLQPNGAATIRDCEFTGNTAEGAGGGGIISSGTGQALFDRCTWQGNSAPLGGGLNMQDGGDEFVTLDVTFNRCDFIGNTATTSQGGGLRLLFASPLLVDVNFLGNSAVRGGGMAAVGGQAGFQVPGSDPRLRNVLFSGNTAQFGGALYLDAGSDPLIYNATISNNTATADGGGLYLTEAGFIPTPNSPEPRVVNSILWGNSDAGGSDESAQIHIEHGLEVVNYTLVQGLTGTLNGGVQNNTGDPLFVDPDGADDVLGTLDDDYRLGAGSPAVDSGNNAPYLSLVTDETDLDCDGVTAEPLALDLGLVVRFVDDPATADTGGGSAPHVDRGAFERGAWSSADRGLAGLHGEPCLVGEGALADGTPVELRLTNGLENSTTSLFIGLSVLDFPGFYGGTLYAFPDFHFSGIPTDGAGTWTIASTWPAGVPAGFTIHMQVWVADGAAPFGLSGTNGVAGVAQ